MDRQERVINANGKMKKFTMEIMKNIKEKKGWKREKKIAPQRAQRAQRNSRRRVEIDIKGI